MNKNSKQNRAILAKAKREVTVSRFRTTPGSTQLSVFKQTIPFGYQPRKSKFAKVARKGTRSRSEVEQEIIEVINVNELERLNKTEIAASAPAQVK